MAVSQSRRLAADFSFGARQRWKFQARLKRAVVLPAVPRREPNRKSADSYSSKRCLLSIDAVIEHKDILAAVEEIDGEIA